MLPSKNRLKLSFFQRGKIAEGGKIAGADFFLTFRKTPNVFRAAVVVAKKVAPRAVDRNRIKRLIYEALRQLNSLEGELIVNVKKNLAGAKMPEIATKLRRQLAKIK